MKLKVGAKGVSARTVLSQFTKSGDGSTNAAQTPGINVNTPFRD